MRVSPFMLAAFIFGIIGSASAYVVKGTVYDSSNNTPLSGVVVQVAGATTQTTTDDQGKFSVNIEPPPAQSPSGTTIPSASQIVDANGAIWTLVTGQIAVNGTVDANTNGVILLLYFTGSVYQETSFMQNGQNCWWKWTGSSWVASTDPRNSSVHMKQAMVAHEMLSVVPSAAHQPIAIRYVVSRQAKVSLAVFDFAGRLVQKLVDGVVEAGVYEAQWSNRSGTAGCYLLRFTAGPFHRTAKIVVTP